MGDGGQNLIASRTDLGEFGLELSNQQLGRQPNNTGLLPKVTGLQPKVASPQPLRGIIRVFSSEQGSREEDWRDARAQGPVRHPAKRPKARRLKGRHSIETARNHPKKPKTARSRKLVARVRS